MKGGPWLGCDATQKSNNVFLYVNYLNAQFSIFYLIIIIIMAVISIAPYLSDKGEHSMFVRLKNVFTIKPQR